MPTRAGERRAGERRAPYHRYLARCGVSAVCAWLASCIAAGVSRRVRCVWLAYGAARANRRSPWLLGSMRA